jgi:hypothetical protein
VKNAGLILTGATSKNKQTYGRWLLENYAVCDESIRNLMVVLMLQEDVGKRWPRNEKAIQRTRETTAFYRKAQIRDMLEIEKEYGCCVAEARKREGL